MVEEQVGQAGESLGRGKWPNRAVPLALAATVRTKSRMSPLRGRDPIRSVEPVGIGQLAPGRFVTIFRQAKIPGKKSDGLPNAGKFTVRPADLEKICIAIPQE